MCVNYFRGENEFSFCYFILTRILVFVFVLFFKNKPEKLLFLFCVGESGNLGNILSPNYICFRCSDPTFKLHVPFF
jgi:hypothetical protein